MKKPSTLAKINLAYALPFHDLGVNVESEQGHEMGKQLRKFYFGYSTLSVETIFVYLMVGNLFLLRRNFLRILALPQLFSSKQILNDKLFAHPTHRTILSRANAKSAATYLLRFNFDSPYSLTKKIFAGRNVPGMVPHRILFTTDTLTYEYPRTEFKPWFAIL